MYQFSKDFKITILVIFSIVTASCITYLGHKIYLYSLQDKIMPSGRVAGLIAIQLDIKGDYANYLDFVEKYKQYNFKLYNYPYNYWLQYQKENDKRRIKILDLEKQTIKKRLKENKLLAPKKKVLERKLYQFYKINTIRRVPNSSLPNPIPIVLLPMNYTFLPTLFIFEFDEKLVKDESILLELNKRDMMVYYVEWVYPGYLKNFGENTKMIVNETLKYYMDMMMLD